MAESFSDIGRIEAIDQLYRLSAYSPVPGLCYTSQKGGKVITASRMYLEGIDFNLVYFPLKHLGYKSVVGVVGELYAALAHLTPGYQAYKDLQDTYNGVVWNTAYGNIDTSRTTAGDVVIWADNCYSVDVTYDANCTLNGQQIDYADATMRIYFLRTEGGGYVISNFETL